MARSNRAVAQLSRRTFLRSLTCGAVGVSLLGIESATGAVALAATGDAAGLDAQSTYPTIIAGQSVYIYIRVKNTGSTTWRGSTGYGYRGTGGWASRWPSGSIWRDVAPGGTLTFEDTVKPPSSPGTYSYGINLTHNGAGFGPNYYIPVTVKAADPPLTMSLQASKTQAAAGESVTLNATTNRSLNGTGYYLVLRYGAGSLGNVSTGTSLSRGVSGANQSITFTAVLSRDVQGTVGVLQSSTVTITWAAPVVSIKPSASIASRVPLVPQIWANNTRKVDYRNIDVGPGTTGLHNCGPASVAMAIQYWNGTGSISLDDAAFGMRGTKNSNIVKQSVPGGQFVAVNSLTSPNDQRTKDLVKARGLVAEPVSSFDDVKRQLSQDRPVVVTVYNGKYVRVEGGKSVPYDNTSNWVQNHIVVVVGYDADNVYVNDPLAWNVSGKNFRIPWQSFRDAVNYLGWNAIVVRKP